METFPIPDKHHPNKVGTSSIAASTRSQSRGSSSSSRSSSASPSQSTRVTTPELPKTPSIARPRLLAEVPKVPSHDGKPEGLLVNDAISRKSTPMSATRPALNRYHTTEALRPPNSHSTQSPSPSTFFSPALATSNIIPRRTSPPRLSVTERRSQDKYLYPPKGDSKKRAASLDDLLLSSEANTTLSPIALIPTDLPFPLPTSVPNSSPQSDSGTTSRSISHGVRRWHALMELISTEEGYLNDLNILVTIYLEHLPSVLSLESEARRDIARNAGALLKLHKKICRRMQRVAMEERLKELGNDKKSTEAQTRVNMAANRVASIFIKEAASFHLYEEFCAGHSQALDLIRRVQNLPEWDMYEKRCAVIVADQQASAEAVKSPETPQTPSPIVRSPSSPIFSVHQRRHSTDVTPKVAPALPRTSRLAMTDFLIKPIQRICKYPLILSQLLTQYEDEVGMSSSRSLRNSENTSLPQGGVNNVEIEALEAMRQVAAKVDEARRKTDIAIKSRLVVERVPEQTLPRLSSLGPCLLAGSLDVVYHHETVAPLSTPIKVKYLGAFLYRGWFLLVKVLKNKVYEPRHWFPLLDIYMTDIAEDDALLPSSFRLSSGEHHFELAAACSQEKVLWMEQIRFARAQVTSAADLPSSLDDALTKPATPTQTSFRALSRKGTTPTTLPPSGGVFPTVLPPLTPPKRRSSLGALEGHNMALENPGLASLITVEGAPDNWELPPSPTVSTVPPFPRSPVRANTAPLGSIGPSTPHQIKALLEGETSTVLIRRSSTNYRKMVDQSLYDVYSEECQAVRIAAQMKEPLFQPPRLTTDAGSTLSARNKMTKRDSVLLKRQKSLAETLSTLSGNSPNAKSPTSLFGLTRNKSAGAVGNPKELRRRTLAIPSFGFFEEKEEDRFKRPSRPSTADSASPATPSVAVTPEDEGSEAITFRTRRQRGKRNSKNAEEPLEKALPDRPPRPNTIHGVSTTEFKFLKELPPTPDAKSRRRNTMITPSKRRDPEEARFSTLPRRSSVSHQFTDEFGQTSVPIFPVGQGLSNAGPPQLGHGRPPKEKSRLHPETIFRKSLNLFGSRRIKSGQKSYLASLFNRSAIDVIPEYDPTTPVRAGSEPPSTPSNRLSASTPALKEALTNWELIPNVSLLKRSDTKATRTGTSHSSCSTDMQSPFNSHTTVPATQSAPVPPLPRHIQTLQPIKSSLRRSSQFIQHFNRLSSN